MSTISTFFRERNWVFASDLNVLLPSSLQPDGVNLCYFKLKILDLTEFIVWNIKFLQHQVAEIQGLKNQRLWQRLNTFILKAFAAKVPKSPCKETASESFQSLDRKQGYLYHFISAKSLKSSVAIPACNYLNGRTLKITFSVP